MKYAIWHHRCTPSKAQVEDALSMGYAIVGIEGGRELALRRLESREDAIRWLSDLRAAISGFEHQGVQISAVFGTIAAPHHCAIGISTLSGETPKPSETPKRVIPVFQSWNTVRHRLPHSSHGHFCWVHVDSITIASPQSISEKNGA